MARSAILTVFLPGFSRLSCLLSSRILQNNLLDLYLVKMRRYKLSWSFFANSETNWNASRISSFSKKSLRYANNRPGTGTSHIIGQNVGQIWSLNLEKRKVLRIFFVKGPEAPFFTGQGDNLWVSMLTKQDKILWFVMQRRNNYITANCIMSRCEVF